MVSGWILALKEKGVRIPKDIAVVGFDDPVWASCMDPPLSAVSQPSYTMDILAFDYLLTQISGSSEKDRKYIDDVILKPSLVIRKSCGFKFKKRGPNLA
jgi:DNA-binding LacI/PurR family transcriptional regulator